MYEEKVWFWHLEKRMITCPTFFLQATYKNQFVHLERNERKEIKKGQQGSIRQNNTQKIIFTEFKWELEKYNLLDFYELIRLNHFKLALKHLQTSLRLEVDKFYNSGFQIKEFSVGKQLSFF